MRAMIGKVTLLYIFVVAFLVGGCKTALDEGFAVAVTVKVDPSVTAPALAAVTRMHVSVVGAETFDYDYDVGSELAGRQGKFLYRPGAKMGALTFRVTLRNAGGQTLGYGESSAVTLVSGKTVQTTVVCTAPMGGDDMVVDLARPTDLTGSDLPVVEADLAVDDLATSDDLPATADDLVAPGPDFTIPTDFTGITLDLTVRDLFNPDLTVQDLKPIQDLFVVQDFVVPPDLVPPVCTLPPAKPRLIGPISTSRVSSRQPIVKWAAASGAATYNVDFCIVPNCTTISSSRTGLTALTTTPTVAMARGARFWRVTAVNGCGSTTSDIWEFFVPGTSKTANTSMIAQGFLDVNKDGSPDFGKASFNGSTRVYVNTGTTLPTTSPLVISKTIPIANAGDVNGDGFGDLLAGDTIYLGSASGLSTSSTLGPFGTGSKQSAAGVGDVDGDGYGDFAIGDGSATGILYFGNSTATLALAGGWVSSGGDIDNDGFADVIVGNSSNAAIVYYGSATARTSMTTVTISKPAAEGANFGFGVAGACDLDGDGTPEVIVSTCQRRNGYVYFGGGRTFGTPVAVPINATTLGCPRASALTCAGDVNGDGIDDLLVGDFGYSGVASFTGQVLLYFGGSTADTLNLTADSFINGSNNTEFSTNDYGSNAIGLGDVNKDGFDDIVFTGSKCVSDQYVYTGSNTGLSTTTNGYFLKYVHAEICDADQMASLPIVSSCMPN